MSTLCYISIIDLFPIEQSPTGNRDDLGSEEGSQRPPDITFTIKRYVWELSKGRNYSRSNVKVEI